MPVVQWVVSVGDTVEARDGGLGVVREIFEGPPQSAQGLFVSSESYIRVVSPGQPDLFVTFEEIVAVSDVKHRVYLKRSLRTINALGCTRGPLQPRAAAATYCTK